MQNWVFLKRNIVVLTLVLILVFSSIVMAVRIGDYHSWNGQQKISTTYTSQLYNCTGDELQDAIDAVPGVGVRNNIGKGTTIYINGDMDISTTITGKSNVCLDFQHNSVNIVGDIPFINLSGNVECFELRNVVINHTGIWTSSIIELCSDGGGVEDVSRIGWNIFDNIKVNTAYVTNPYNYTFLNMTCIGKGRMPYNTFSNIKFSQCTIAVHLRTFGASSYGYGNRFENWFVGGYKNGVVYWESDGAATHSFFRNTFFDVKAQTTSYSEYGFRNISGSGNIFVNSHIWDWNIASNPQWTWSIDGTDQQVEAENTFIQTCGTPELHETILDKGVDTIIIDNEWDIGWRNINVNNSINYPIWGCNDNLVLSVPMDTGVGDRLFDFSGCNHHSVDGLFNWTDGVVGTSSAIVLDSTVTEVVVFNDTYDLNFSTNDFSIECWVKYPLSNPEVNGGFLSKGNFGGALVAGCWYIGYAGSNTDEFKYFDVQDAAAGWNIAGTLGETDIPDGWHHFVVTRVGYNAGVYRLYMDGRLVDTETGAGVATLENTYDLHIGDDGASSGNCGVTMDGLRLYHRALTVDEIRSHWVRSWDNSSGTDFVVPVTGSAVGSRYYDVASDTLYIFDGSTWNAH